MPTPSTDPADIGAADLRDLYQAGTLSPVEVLEAVMARIDTLEPLLNTYVVTDFDAAREAARASEARWQAGQPAGLLDGVPVSVKDLALTKGLPTGRGSLTLPPDPGHEDSPVARNLRDSGAVIIGKTTTSEFGWKGAGDCPATGITRNPWSPDRTPGASSAGAAAGLAAGLATLATGSDGGGSIRIPAAFCGLYGIKPTFARVPLYPPSFIGPLSHVGPMARSVADMAMTLQVMSRPDNRDIQAPPAPTEDYVAAADGSVAGLRIAYCPAFDGAKVEPGVAQAVKSAAASLEQQGALVSEIEPPFASPFEAYYTLFAAAFTHLGGAWTEEQRRVADPGLVELVDLGRSIDLAGYLEAQSAKDALCQTVAGLFDDYDLLLTPTLPLTAFAVGRDAPEPVSIRPAWLSWNPFTYPFNMTQHPAASAPCGLVDGLPAGCQIVGPRFGEAVVLRACRAVEQALPPARLDIGRLKGLAASKSTQPTS